MRVHVLGFIPPAIGIAASLVLALPSQGSDTPRSAALDAALEVPGFVSTPKRPPPPLLSGDDPDLEPGFPVQTYETAGGFYAGQGIHVLVGNIDDDPTLEILGTALASGPLYAWNADGSPQPGWPAGSGVAYPGLGELSTSFPGLEISAAQGANVVAYNGAGAILPGWPRSIAINPATPPTLIDVDDDGLDEIFVDEHDGSLWGYRADGSYLPGWPAYGGLTPAIGDLDGDGNPEIVTASRGDTSGTWLFAYHRDSTRVVGFPVHFESELGNVLTFPVIGDVDADGEPEIVVVVRAPASGGRISMIAVVAANGTVERTMTVPSWPTGGTVLPPLLPN